ncbi:MAG TPA: hypothetical protein VFE77_09165 [Rhodanobacter sp.]|nr:hypothetical protein [Rhodanobacter sp.]
MLVLLDRKERRMLNQLCNEPWVENYPYDPDVSLRLERNGLAYLSILGEWRPTTAGRLKASTMTVVTLESPVAR